MGLKPARLRGLCLVTGFAMTRRAPTIAEDKEMAQKSLNDVLEAPLFQPVIELPESDVRDVLQSDFVGATVGRGAESIVRLSPHPGLRKR